MTTTNDDGSVTVTVTVSRAQAETLQALYRLRDVVDEHDMRDEDVSDLVQKYEGRLAQEWVERLADAVADYEAPPARAPEPPPSPVFVAGDGLDAVSIGGLRVDDVVACAHGGLWPLTTRWASQRGVRVAAVDAAGAAMVDIPAKVGGRYVGDVRHREYPLEVVRRREEVQS